MIFLCVNIAPSKWRWTRSDHSCLATNETHKKNVRYENVLRMSQDWGLEFDQLSASVCIQKALSVSAGHIKRLKSAIWLTREDDRRLLAVNKNQFHNQAPIQIIHILSSQSFQCRKGTNNFFLIRVIILKYVFVPSWEFGCSLLLEMDSLQIAK